MPLYLAFFEFKRSFLLLQTYSPMISELQLETFQQLYTSVR